MVEKVKNNKMISFGIALLFVLFGMVVYFRNNFFNKNKTKDTILNLDEKTSKRMKFTIKSFEEIFKQKPDLVITYKAIELFGGNCKLTELIFRKLDLSEKITKDNYKKNLEKFFTSNLQKKYSENLLRALIMLHYSIKTNAYPKINGKMSYDIFKPLERL